MINQRLLRAYGLDKLGRFRSDVTEMYEAEIEAAVMDRHMVAILGGFGSGKSELVKTTLGRLAADASRGLDLIQVVDPERDKVRISNVLNAIIYFYNDSPRREREARAMQAIRHLGLALTVNKRRPVIVIEEAHRVHHETFRALKDLRERMFDGKAPLFSVILVGQGGLHQRIAKHGEVFFRTNVVTLSEEDGWMTHAERVSYLEQVFADAIEAETRSRIALRATTPLQLNYEVEQLMRRGFQLGYDVIGENLVPATMAELKALTGASVREVADRSGVPHSTVQDALKRGDDHPKAEAVRSTLEELVREREGQANGFAEAA
ncbi:MAG: AAA family ATPase [Bacteroidota bacterium]